MNVANALKLKNRLAGELNRLQSILERENARRSDSVSKVNRKEVWDQILATSDRLGLVKARIAEANVPIYANLERMAELKSRIAFLNGLQMREGEEIMFVGRDQEKLVYQWDSFLNREQVDSLTADLRKQIEALQDACDSYNNKTDIDV
jgi:hypothetical protein